MPTPAHFCSLHSEFKVKKTNGKQPNGRQKYLWKCASCVRVKMRRVKLGKIIFCLNCGSEFCRVPPSDPGRMSPSTFQSCTPECQREVALLERSRRQTLRLYGLRLPDYTRLFEVQGGVCSICQIPPNSGGVLSVDHCHSTGRVRGLLCNACNSGLGHFKDSLSSLASAAEYLAA